MHSPHQKTLRNPPSSAAQQRSRKDSSAVSHPFQDNRASSVAQRHLQEGMQSHTPNTIQLREENNTQRQPNRTGLPDQLKSGVENLSGVAMDDVRVHYNSSKPAQLQAHAYAQGTDIHLAPGQEKHLPHEAWHVVQQKQGRVKPTKQLKAGVQLNDEARLEREADVMGSKTAQLRRSETTVKARTTSSKIVQRTQTVDVKRTQKLIKDSAGGKLAGTTFEWQSKFDVDIIDGQVVVTIKISAAVTSVEFKRWADQVSAKWSKRFMIAANGKHYPIVVRLAQVTRGAHYAVEVARSGSALGSGGRAHFGTENMTKWGVHDTTNIAHEVGHMLGNVDEYGEVETGGKTTDYTKKPSTSIMAVPTNNPISKHYYLIQWAADQELKKQGLLGSTDSSTVVADVASRRGGVPTGAPAVASLGDITAARSRLKKTTPSPEPKPKATSSSAAAASSTPAMSKEADKLGKIGMELNSIKESLEGGKSLNESILDNIQRLVHEFHRLYTALDNREQSTYKNLYEKTLKEINALINK